MGDAARLAAALVALASVAPGCGHGGGTPSPTTPPATTTGTPGTPTDADLDGFDTPFDCDDANPSVHPGAAEITCDSLDNDCVDGDARSDCALELAEADLVLPPLYATPSLVNIVADLDGLPGDELVTQNGPGSSIWTNLGGNPTRLDFPEYDVAYTAGDATGDGQADLWFRSWQTAFLVPGPITASTNPRKDAITRIFGVPQYPGWTALAHEDVDGDGLVDLVENSGLYCPSTLRGDVSAYDACRWTSEAYLIYWLGWPGAIGLSDVTGDGVPDLEASDHYGGDVAVLAANGAGWGTSDEVEAVVTLGDTSLSASQLVMPGDLDGDGYPDLALASTSRNGKKDGDLFAVPGPIPANGDVVSASAGAWATIHGLTWVNPLGDVDADGLPELTGAGLDGIPAIVRLPGPGEWDAADVSVTAVEPPDSLWTSASQQTPGGDVDGDGRVDFTVRSVLDGNVYVFTTLAEVRP